MGRRENSLFVNEPFFSSPEEVGPEDFTIGNDLGGHQPDDPPEMAVPPLADLAFSFLGTHNAGYTQTEAGQIIDSLHESRNGEHTPFIPQYGTYDPRDSCAPLSPAEH